MPYYTAGDYYGRGDYYRGDPGLLGSIAKIGGKILGGVIKATPIGGIVSTAVDIGRGLLSRPAAQSAQPGGAMIPQVAPPGPLAAPRMLQAPGGGGGVAVARVSPLGTVGVCPTEIVYTKAGQPRRYRLKKGGGCTWHKKPTMNVMNPRAAGRAISRIKGARNLLKRIESGLPVRKARSAAGKRCGCK